MKSTVPNFTYNSAKFIFKFMKESNSFVYNCLFCVDIPDFVGQGVLLRLKFIFHIEDYFLVE